MKLLPLLAPLSITDKYSRIVKLGDVINWAQREFLVAVEQQIADNRPVRIIVLKARQLGISTITEGLAFSMSFVIPRNNSLVVSHEMDSSEHLLGMTQTYWDTYPFKKLYTTKYQGRKHLAWNETGSQIRIATAKNATGGRSRTIHFLHASEVAFWDNAETTMLALRQTMPYRPNTFEILESTANGVGNFFYNTWNAAIDGEIEHVPLFFPWWRHPEYMASYIQVPYTNLGNLDGEEKALQALGVSDDRLAWRRWAIKNLTNSNVEQFHQEYPSTPEEAFVATGTNVFSIGHLKQCYEPMEGQPGRLTRDGSVVRFQPDIAGPLRVFKPPSSDLDWGMYFVGGDPTHTTRGDYAVAQVINRRTYEQVATWRGKIDPYTFGDELAKLGTYYNNAMVSTEVEGPGSGTVSRLISLEYPNIWQHHWADKAPGKIGTTYGWSTNFQRKNWAIGWLLKLVVDHQITIHDSRTFIEMRDYVTLPDGGFGNADPRGNDDTVMGLAIAVICNVTEGVLPAYGDGSVATFIEQKPAWMEWGNDDGEVA